MICLAIYKGNASPPQKTLLVCLKAEKNINAFK